jgi:hypothetical protein
LRSGIQGFDNSSATFFDTSQGLELFAQSLDEFAQKVVNKYSEAFCFEIPFEVGCDLEVGQDIRWSQPNYVSKISAITLIADGVKRYAKIEVCCLPEWLEIWTQKLYEYRRTIEALDESAPDHKKNWWQKHRSTLSPLLGFKPPTGSGNHGIVHEICVQNDADTQLALIAERGGGRAEIECVLSENPTKITVCLSDMTTKRVLERCILHSVDL